MDDGAIAAAVLDVVDEIQGWRRLAMSPLPPFLAVVIALGAIWCVPPLIAALTQRRDRRWRRVWTLNQKHRRVDAALAEQRTMRMQNEVLIREIRARKKIEADLSGAVSHDAVTGLNNRAYLIQRIQEQLICSGGAHASALLLIDIDHFKLVNERVGYRQGDRLLKALGKRLRTHLHDADTLAGLGGNVYAILLDHVPPIERAMTVAQDVLRLIEQPVGIAGTVFELSASIGLCTLDATYRSAEAMLRDADLAVVAAKRAGGAQVIAHEPSMLAESMAALHAKAELAAAIERNEFELFYQPIIHLDDESPCGVEALIRWNHPDKGLVSPGAFIPLAEETGHIVEIGRWVLRQACTEYEQLRCGAAKQLLMTLNVSIRQLETPSFIDELRVVLRETMIPPERLQLEITESVLMSDPKRIGGLFEEIRSMGVKIAFDDFGTGYSSLSYLQRYPVDTLKIDQSFVRGLEDSPVNLDIVRLVLQLAEVTGMGVCAEGIETSEEAAKLKSIGCTVAQGYHFSRPMALDKCLRYLAQSAAKLLQAGTPQAAYG